MPDRWPINKKRKNEEKKAKQNARAAGAPDLVAGHEPEGELDARDARAVLRRGPAGGPRAAAPCAHDDQVKVIVIGRGGGRGVAAVLGGGFGGSRGRRGGHISWKREEGGASERKRERERQRERESAEKEKRKLVVMEGQVF